MLAARCGERYVHFTDEVSEAQTGRVTCYLRWFFPGRARVEDVRASDFMKEVLPGEASQEWRKRTEEGLEGQQELR